MNIQDLLNSINKTYGDTFGRTPIKARLEDILKEAFELTRARDFSAMKEETSDLLGTLLQWINEAGYDFKELVDKNIAKINNRSLYRTLGRKISVALIGGAFDPVHNGHMKIASFLLNKTNLFDEVWLVPCYRHLYGKKMAPATYRLAMCGAYALIDKRIKVCDYEIIHELAGETYYFLNKFLEEDFAKNEYRFSYVIGLDNANTFHQWMNYEYLKEMIPFVVISRQGEKKDKNVNWYLKDPHMYFDVSIPNISSTMIRKMLKEERDSFFQNHVYNYGVADIIKKNTLYI